MKANKVFSVALVCIAALAGCNDSTNKNTGYDGKVFDISVKQDKSLTASIKKVGTNFELTISGEGEALSYERKELVPWNAISKKINKVIIEDGIENIGDYYFRSTTLDTYFLPSSVNQIEANSFNTNSKIYSYSTTPINVNGDNNIYYYSETKPATYGEYWHLIGDGPVVWDQYKLLFIGNSFTFFPNDVFSTENPAVCALAKEIGTSLGLDLEIDFVVKGAHTLKKFANEKDEMGSIVDSKLKENSDYDFVILQEHSTTPVNDYNSFNNAVGSLIKKVEATQKDCEVYLYSTWGFPSAVNETSIFSSVSKMEELLRNAYIKCGEENNVKVNQVGKAFTYVYENYKYINLYGSDDKHQNYAGAFLSSCVHIASIFNIDIREATFNGTLDPSVAATLREVAYNVVFK